MPKVKTNLKRCKSDFGLRRRQAIQRSQEKISNEERFNKVTRLDDYRYNNSRLDEEIDINLGLVVKGDIKNEVENRYIDLEKLLASNLGERMKDVYEMQDRSSEKKQTISINQTNHGSIIKVYPI